MVLQLSSALTENGRNGNIEHFTYIPSEARKFQNGFKTTWKSWETTWKSWERQGLRRWRKFFVSSPVSRHFLNFFFHVDDTIHYVSSLGFFFNVFPMANVRMYMLYSNDFFFFQKLTRKKQNHESNKAHVSFWEAAKEQMKREKPFSGVHTQREARNLKTKRRNKKNVCSKN